MSKISIVIIIYIMGLIFGALVLNIWGAETSISKAAFALFWTAFFLIALFYTDKKKRA